MHRIHFILFLFVTAIIPAYASPPISELRPNIDKDVPLAYALERYNRLCPDNNPLTEAEVIAAIRNIKIDDPDISPAVLARYQRVVDEKILPAGMHFHMMNAWIVKDTHFDVVWHDLELMPLPLGSGKDPEIGYGYNFRIRARYISSRPLTEEEIARQEETHARIAAAIEQRQKEKEQSEEDTATPPASSCE